MPFGCHIHANECDMLNVIINKKRFKKANAKCEYLTFSMFYDDLQLPVL